MNPNNTKDTFAMVTDVIIKRLEEGIVPWRQPWKASEPPCNYVTRRPYRGINQLLLNTLPYPTKEFLTFNQVKDLGGSVKKGEKAHLVILWLWMEEKDEDGEGKPIKRPQLRYYYVFNIAQCVDIPSRTTPLPIPQPFDSIERCEAIIEGMQHPPKIVHNDNEAYYHPEADFINMPQKEVFESPDAYYGTLFHELIHSTGHTDRLNRKELMHQGKFGNELYAIEELTAEIGACYLSSHASIALGEFDNSMAYIKHWLTRLRSDKRLIVYASSQAQKATDYILGISHKEQERINHTQNETV